MSALKKTETNECLVSKEVIEASDRLRKETMDCLLYTSDAADE